MAYADRQPSINELGLECFCNDEDRANELEVKEILEKAWNCELHHWAEFSPIDWYATRGGEMVSVIELKSRTHTSTHFPTVFLNLRKWLYLTNAQLAFGVPALFVVKFLDCIRYINVYETVGSRITIGGCGKIVKPYTDIEPVLNVPVASMKKVKVDL